MLDRLDHVQLAMPRGEEEKARGFYVGLLGMSEVKKPVTLASRGGAWFRAGEVQLHLGIDAEFSPARQAHPAFVANELEALAERLESAGVHVRWDADLPGYARFYANDPFGNRLEFLRPLVED